MLPKTGTNPTSPTPSQARRTKQTLDLVLDPAEHEVTTTASRQLRSAEDFLFAVRWAVAQGFHPRATTLTVKVAEALATKMNRQGHMSYGRDRLAEQLGVSTSTIRDHTRVLRELGLLVWVEHGSRRNVLRTKNPNVEPRAYTATGTIFAACSPPAWDTAMGRTLSGTGYQARLHSVNDRGRRYETKLARLAAKAKGAARRATRPNAGRSCPPSVSGFSSSSKITSDEKNNYTRTRENQATLRTDETPTVTPLQLKALIDQAAQVADLVPWLRHVPLRRLAYLLRPCLLAGDSAVRIAGDLRSRCHGWAVQRPLAFLSAVLNNQRPAVPTPRVDQPVTWLAVRPARSTTPLPAYQPTPQAPPASIAADPHALEAWERQYAAQAFAELLERWQWQDTTPGSCLNDLVPVYPVVNIPVDDEGQRWATMVEKRRMRHEEVSMRTQHIRRSIRATLAKGPHPEALQRAQA